MNGRSARALILIAAATIPACATGLPASGPRMDERDVAKVHVCATTKAEIVSLFGEPKGKGIVDGLQSWQWQHFRISMSGFPSDVQTLNVALDDRDVVVDMAFNPPRAYVPANKCAAKAPREPLHQTTPS
jgi:hypothetical protein